MIGNCEISIQEKVTPDFTINEITNDHFTDDTVLLFNLGLNSLGYASA